MTSVVSKPDTAWSWVALDLTSMGGRGGTRLCARRASEKDPQVGLARAIRKRRTDLDLTQKELAARCGMKVSAVSRLESDAANPSWGTMRRVARALVTSIEAIAEVSEDLERRLSRKKQKER